MKLRKNPIGNTKHNERNEVRQKERGRRRFGTIQQKPWWTQLWRKRATKREERITKHRSRPKTEKEKKHNKEDSTEKKEAELIAQVLLGLGQLVIDRLGLLDGLLINTLRAAARHDCGLSASNKNN